MATAERADDKTLSVECTLAKQPGYRMTHDLCRQTEDVPLPHSQGMLLVRRCGCRCHRR